MIDKDIKSHRIDYYNVLVLKFIIRCTEYYVYIYKCHRRNMSWPGESPELNPVENIWSHIKYTLTGKPFSTTPT